MTPALGLSRRRIRALLVATILVSIAFVAAGAASPPSTANPEEVPRPDARDGVTVVTESARHGTIIAWNPDGSLLYYDDQHTKYFDVDPVAGTSRTVEYTATDTIHTRGPTCSAPPCARNVVERVNLSTGEVTEVYARYDYKESAGEWHDHVRVNETHVLIADILDDQVFMVNTETETVTWLWDAQSEFPVEGGGPWPEDWSHINDVELLDDGRVMVSMRNQDQVVFLDRETGVVDNWTLGTDDDHDVLYEQHNPDYIPEARGGPAVVVADSENRRIVEYQREGDNWTRTWTWQDDRIQWPRDADRLPGGNTLVVDTHGGRVLEVAPDGSVAWVVELEHPYDAERLGTGPGSSGGESAARLGLQSRTDAGADDDGGSVLATVTGAVVGLVPARIGNGIFYVAPVWMGRREFVFAGVAVLTTVAWLGAEGRWYLPPLGVRSPLYVQGPSAGDAADRPTDEGGTDGEDAPDD
jgi:hypothetical protein